MEQSYNFIMNELNLQYNDCLVVAVSGGPDSMALLSLLVKVKNSLSISVICAHVNHNVRKESHEEKKFVEKFCALNNIIFETMTIEDYGDDNFHNEARSKRYVYFKEIVSKYKAKYLFTAHHADDLIETILMRIVRGSTLRGYSGFSKQIKMDKYEIVRPLINVTKEEILNYCKKGKISFVQDLSNKKDVYTRNRFRKYIVPEFKKEDVMVHQKFYKFSKTLLEYNEYIDKQVKKDMRGVYIQGILNIDKFLLLENVIQNKIIYLMLEERYQDDLMLITDHHATLIINLIKSKKANSCIYLPNNVKACKAYNNFMLVLENVNLEYEIELSNYISLPNGKSIEVVNKTNIATNFVCRLSKSDVLFPLHVRTRRNGDKMYVKGMLGSKKINDIFIDSKIATKERDLWPIVVDSSGKIVWIPGLKKTKFDKSKDEKYDIILRYY